MRKFLLPFVTLAMIVLPAAANAEQCRNTATGKFAKCGAPGAVLASQYVAKGNARPKTAHAMTPAMAPNMAPTMAGPATTATKPGFMAKFKPKAKAAPAPGAMPMAKPARCKSAKGKFVKCGTMGAKPA